MLQWLFNGMARVSVFTVHEPPEAGGTRLERAESLVFVGDGFSWRAALFSPFYLLLRGEWLALAVYIAAAVVLSAIFRLTGIDDQWLVWMFVLLNVVTGFEMSELKRWSLSRAGWQEIATVSGRGQEEAERRFFDIWLPSLAVETAEERHPTAGLFASPGHHQTASRVEPAVQRLAARLRSTFMPKT